MLLVDVVKAESSSLIRKLKVSIYHVWQPARQDFDLQRCEADTFKGLLIGIDIDKAAEERNTPIVPIARVLALERGVFAHIGIMRRRYGLTGRFEETNQSSITR